MCEALSEMSSSTVPSESDRTEEHLNPANNRVGFSDHTVRLDSIRAQSTLMNVKLQVDAERNLKEDGNKDDICERPVH